MGYRICDDFVNTHFSDFYHLTMPMLDTINNAVGYAFDPTNRARSTRW